MSTTDRLAQIRARAEAATPGPWNYGAATDDPMPLDERIEWVADTLGHDGENRHLWAAWVQREPGYVDIPALTGDGVRGEENAAFIAHAREDIPALLAAVDAVLGLHDFAHDGGRHDWCLHCGNAWPCPTVRAITEALA